MFKAIGIGLLVFLGIVLFWGLIFGFTWATAPFRGALDQREQIQASGDFRIHSYQHFYNLCRSIQQAEAQYDNQYDLLQQLERGDGNFDRQQRNVAVLKAQIERLKQKYNGDAAQEETLAAFKDSDLPKQIELGGHVYGHRTDCSF